MESPFTFRGKQTAFFVDIDSFSFDWNLEDEENSRSIDTFDGALAIASSKENRYNQIVKILTETLPKLSQSSSQDSIGRYSIKKALRCLRQ